MYNGLNYLKLHTLKSMVFHAPVDDLVEALYYSETYFGVESVNPYDAS